MINLRASRLMFCVILIVLTFPVVPLSAGQGPDLAALDKYIAQCLRDWQVPGAAIAIVRNDSVLLAKGYGVRTLGKNAPVDIHTLFAVASLSKAFTTASLGILVDQGKLRWDDHVTDYLPYFQMYDPYVTREMTVKDLCSHRSGLATFGGDLLWYGTTYDRKEVIKRIRYLKPKYGFRAGYGYQNIMFLTAGEIIPAITGRSWEEFVRDSIFMPLGMTESVTTVRALDGLPDVATPHTEFHGTIMPVPYRNVDNVAPAAGVNSNVHDLALWIRMWLRDDDASGVHRLSSATRHEIFSAQLPLRISPRGMKALPSRHFSTACLGWFAMDYQGRKVLTHGGAMDGMISQITLVPEEKLGLIVLTNSVKSPASAIANRILDAFLGAPDRDWSAEGLKAVQRGEVEEKSMEEAAEQSRQAGTKPSLSLERYAGTYRSEMYGDVVAAIEKGALVLKFVPSRTYVADLTQWQFDTFRAVMRDPTLPQKGFVTFVIDALGSPAEMRVNIPNPDFDFRELELRRVSESLKP